MADEVLGSKLIKNEGIWKHKVLIGTPVTGLVRIEWVLARYGQLMPTNWSHADSMEWMPTTAPLGYVVSDAQNLIVKDAIEKEVEWLLLLEQDNVIPQNTFWKLTDYMRDKTYPVVSGLYFTKSNPPEPMIYRGEGDSYYDNWKMGDLVMASGVPTGCLLVHMSIIREMWNDAPEYVPGEMGNKKTRRVFQEPSRIWFDPDAGQMRTEMGTSDLAWCKQVMQGNYFKKAGWDEFQDKKYPFLVDTNIFVRHIRDDGVQFPLEIPKKFEPDAKKKKTTKKTTK